MNTNARRPDAPASGREPTAVAVAPPTPVRARPGRSHPVARVDAPSVDVASIEAASIEAASAVPSGRPAGAAVPSSEVPITITTAGVAR